MSTASVQWIPEGSLPLLSVGLAFLAYVTYNATEGAAFRYITQTDFPLCGWMNGTFCDRISKILTVLLVYYVYIQTSSALSVPATNAFQDPPKHAVEGVGIGAGIAVTSIVLSLLFGFVDLKGIDFEKLVYAPIIVVGMLMTGCTEELVFRALPINALRPYVPESLLVLGTALLFGFVHLEYSLYYGFAAFVAGLLLGSGFLKHGFFWAAGLHAAFNTVETTFYSSMKYKIKNPLMAGERKTPDDDGVMTSIVELAALLGLKYMNYL